MAGNGSLIDRIDRKTAADVVYETLHDRISSLEFLPHDKISEVEVAEEFGVSRQPVRDAFARLAQVGFLTVRPQRATRVTPFSQSAIQDARFVRLAVEMEILRVIAKDPSALPVSKIERNLSQQETAVQKEDSERFHDLDNAFHELLCIGAGRPNAFATITKMKVQVDRLCKLSLGHSGEPGKLVEDHRSIVNAVTNGDFATAESHMRTHLSRLDNTIETVRQKHPTFFGA